MKGTFYCKKCRKEVVTESLEVLNKGLCINCTIQANKKSEIPEKVRKLKVTKRRLLDHSDFCSNCPSWQLCNEKDMRICCSYYLNKYGSDYATDPMKKEAIVLLLEGIKVKDLDKKLQEALECNN